MEHFFVEQFKMMHGDFVISLINGFTHMAALMLEYKLIKSTKITPRLNSVIFNKSAKFQYQDQDVWHCRCSIDMAESEEELKSLLMKVKEESEKAGLKLSI